MEQSFPHRIVCLTDETTEVLYLLEEDWRIVGISAFTKRPARAQKEKAVVSGFRSADADSIVALQPDLVLAFSDVQAEIASLLIARGLEVHVFNQRSLGGILQMIRTLGGLVGCPGKAAQLADKLATSLRAAGEESSSRRPRVYFEEWDEPLVTGIGWVSELIDCAGGIDLFAQRAGNGAARDRVVKPEEVIELQPDVIVASWCGKPFQREELIRRPGWADLPAVRNKHVFELDSSIILQPGPAALTDGLAALRKIIAAWRDV